MPNWILTGIAAGLAAAAMQGVALSLSLFTIIIFYLSPLPLFLAGFSRGWASALLGATVMSVVLAVLTGSAAFALMALISAGLAPTVASALSMITRTASETSTEGESRTDDREWYPEGRLVLWLAAIAATVTGISVLVMGSDIETFKSFLTTQITPIIDALEKQMPPEQPKFPRENFITMMITALPLVASAIWLLSTVTSMRMAIVFLTRTNRALRPWALFDNMAYPANAIIPVLGALVAAFFLGGILQLLALAIVGAFITAFALLGLAVIHHFLAKSSARPLMLGLLYSGLLLFSWVLAVPLTVLGLIDINFNLRKSQQNNT